MARRRRGFQPDPALIEMLEELLADARRGDLREALVVWTDGEREGWWRYYALDAENLVYEARVATADIRARTNKGREPGMQ